MHAAGLPYEWFSSWLAGWLEFNVPFQHKYGYVRDKNGSPYTADYRPIISLLENLTSLPFEIEVVDRDSCITNYTKSVRSKQVVAQ